MLANNTHSSFQNVIQGVPQGSVLGPLFYIIYANDISRVIKHCRVALYADDTVLYLGNNDFSQTVSKMQEDIDALSRWCSTNGIHMNVDKTKLMLFGTQKKIDQLPVFDSEVNNSPLELVPHYKYLGIKLDSQLNYKLHVQKIITSVTNKLRQFRRMRFFLDTKAAILVYKNMILPVLEYGDIIMVGTNVGNRKKLQILQNKGLRCALNRDRDTSRDELHAEAGLLKLKYRRDLHVLNYMFDMSQIEGNIQGPREEAVRTRSQHKKLFKLRKPKTEKYKRSLAYRGPNKWNELPSDLYYLSSRAQFGHRLQLHLKTPLDTSCNV